MQVFEPLSTTGVTQTYHNDPKFRQCRAMATRSKTLANTWNSPDAVGALADGPAHGDAGVVGAHLASELIDGLQQRLPSQGRGVHGGGGSHGYERIVLYEKLAREEEEHFEYYEEKCKGDFYLV